MLEEVVTVEHGKVERDSKFGATLILSKIPDTKHITNTLSPLNTTWGSPGGLGIRTYLDRVRA